MDTLQMRTLKVLSLIFTVLRTSFCHAWKTNTGHRHASSLDLPLKPLLAGRHYSCGNQHILSSQTAKLWLAVSLRSSVLPACVRTAFLAFCPHRASCMASRCSFASSMVPPSACNHCSLMSESGASCLHTLQQSQHWFRFQTFTVLASHDMCTRTSLSGTEVGQGVVFSGTPSSA